MLTKDNVAAHYEHMGEHLARMGAHNHRVYLARGMEPRGHACEECRNEIDYFMLTDEVWASLPVNQSACLCLTCVVKHLGRPLQIADFSPAPVNRTILAGIIIGLAHQEAPNVQA